MFSRLRLFELKNTKFKTIHHFFIELSKDLEVVNFRFLANFRFLTIPLLTNVIKVAAHRCKINGKESQLDTSVEGNLKRLSDGEMSNKIQKNHILSTLSQYKILSYIQISKKIL